MTEQIATVIIATFIVYVFTNLGWVLFRNKNKSADANKLLLIENDLNSFKHNVEKNDEVTTQRLNAHSEELKTLKESLSRREEREKHVEGTLEDLKGKVDKIIDLLMNKAK